MENMEWLTGKDLKQKKYKRVFWSIGALEDHGIGPIGTDKIASQKIAEDLAEHFNVPLLPPLPFGVCRGMFGRWGTFTVRDEIFKNFIYDIGVSVRRNGFSELFIINGHGGQIQSLKDASFLLQRDTGLKIATIHWWILAKDISEKYFGTQTGHGGAEEIAMIHLKNPEFFKKESSIPPAFYEMEGTDCYPYPRGTLLYKRGKLSLEFLEKAEEYYKELIQKVKSTIHQIIEGWELE